MAKILPFKGIRYNVEKIKDISCVITPPYDVISNQAQEQYYQNSPYNIIRLILGKDFPDDNKHNNKYTRALALFQKWQQEKILIQDTEDSFYLYEQEFTFKEEKKIRSGFIGLLELSEFGAKQIYPHEKTFDKPKLDRMQLLETCRANFSPIFGLYYEKKSQIKKLLVSEKKDTNKIIDVTDEDRIVHRVWQINDKQLITRIVAGLKDKQIFIADGHHRYEAALNFRDKLHKLQKGNYTGKEPYNYVMIYLTNLNDDGITILPTHRLLRRIPTSNFRNVIEKIETSFNIKEVKNKSEMLNILDKYKDKNRYIFGMYYNNTDIKGFYILTLKNKKILTKVIDKTKPDEYNKLNITVLHSLIIDKLLSGRSKNKDYQDNIAYTHDEDEAVRLIGAKNYKIAFFLNPARTDALRNIALAGSLMPQKSTYFYPKLETGLVINKF